MLFILTFKIKENKQHFQDMLFYFKMQLKYKICRIESKELYQK